MTRSNVLQVAIIVACAAGQAACSSNHPSQPEAAAPGAPSAFAVTSPAAGQHYQAGIALDGQPKVTADGKDIVVTVHVTNTGTGIFGSASSPHPINVGSHSIDASGKVVNLDLSRGNLPPVEPGATVTATIKMPADQLLGKRAEILPVEEGVSWFNQWSTHPTVPVIVGPFEACSSPGTGKVCDASRKPLAVFSGSVPPG